MTWSQPSKFNKCIQVDEWPVWMWHLYFMLMLLGCVGACSSRKILSESISDAFLEGKREVWQETSWNGHPRVLLIII